MKKLFILTLFFILVTPIVRSQNTKWEVNLLKDYFIENNNYHQEKQLQDVIYWTQSLQSNVYFLNDKVVFERFYANTKKKNQYPNRKHKDSLLSYMWSIDFENTNSDVTLLASQMQNHQYITNTGKSKTYKKVTYYNVWKYIDIEFYLPKSGGLKYNIILNPGANPNDVQFKYNGVENLEITKNNNLKISTKIDELNDKAPITYYEESKEKIESKYFLKDGILSINLKKYDNTKSVIIDPWITVFPVGNYGCDLDYDNDNNLYVNYATDVFTSEIQKYNNLGVLQWTYGSQTTFSDVVVKRTTQDIFIFVGVPFTFSGDVLGIKIDDLGNVITDYIHAINFPEELWRANYDYCNNQIVLGTGGSSNAFQGAILSDDLTTMTAVNMVGSATGNRDVNNLILDPDGLSCYMIIPNSSLVDGLYDNVLLKASLPNLSTTLWQVGSGYAFNEFGNFNIPSSGSFNGIACGLNYLYTYDGLTIKQWDKSNGNLVNTVNVANSVLGSSGIDVDPCGNIYVGITGAILIFNSSLTQINSIPINGNCYDLIIGNDNKLYACGTNFVTEIQLNIPLSISYVDDNCNQGVGTATIICDNVNSLSVLWAQTGETTAQISNLSQGWYTVTVSGNTCADSYSIIDSVYIDNVNNNCVFSISLVDSIICSSECIDLIVNSSSNLNLVDFAWDNGINVNNDSINICPNVTTNYNVVATNANGDVANASATITVVAPPDVDLGSDVNICNSPLVLDAGNSGATYLWQDNSINQTFNVTQTGIYSVEVKIGNCIDYDTISVIVDNPIAIFSITDTIGCNPFVTNFTDLSTANTQITNWNWAFGDGESSNLQHPTHTYSQSGNYTISLQITTVNGCVSNVSQNVNIQTSLQPIANFTFSPSSPLLNADVVFEDLSENTTAWYWDFGDGLHSNIQSPTHIFNTINFYNVSLHVSNGNCVDSIIKSFIIKDELLFYIPNAFTPDGDEYNNTFQPVFTSGYDPFDYHLTIFNRWGETIFESYNSTIGWDGSYDSQTLVGDGVYTWKIEFGEVNSDKRQQYTGHVVLLR